MTPVERAIDQMLSDFNRRHAWLSTASEMVRKWRDEDGGWDDDFTKGTGAAQEAARRNHG